MYLASALLWHKLVYYITFIALVQCHCQEYISFIKHLGSHSALGAPSCWGNRECLLSDGLGDSPLTPTSQLLDGGTWGGGGREDCQAVFKIVTSPSWSSVSPIVNFGILCFSIKFPFRYKYQIYEHKIGSKTKLSPSKLRYNHERLRPS